MKRFVETEIETITRIATSEIPAIIASPQVTRQQYEAKRLELNLHLIQALTGAEVVAPKKAGGSNKMKFCHRLPTKSDIAKIASIVDTYIRDVENPFLSSLPQEVDNNVDEEMGIPSKTCVQIAGAVPAIDKVNNKKLNDVIFGYDGNRSISSMLLGAMDCIQIAALGEEARERANWTKFFIIGGIALAVVGAGAAAAIIYNNSKKNEEPEETDIIDDETIDLEDNAPIVDLDDDGAVIDLDDAPVMDLV